MSIENQNYSRRAAIGLIAGFGASFLLNPLEALAAPRKEVDMNTIEYGSALQDVPSYNNIGGRIVGYHAQNGLMCYVPVDEKWATTVQDTRTKGFARQFSTGLFVPREHIRTRLPEELEPIPFQPGEERHIEVSIGQQHMWVVSTINGRELPPLMDAPVSTGVYAHPTPKGTFTLLTERHKRRMIGTGYDLDDVSDVEYFTESGAAFHGAYWNHDLGHRHSHGCVNLSPENALKLRKLVTKDRMSYAMQERAFNHRILVHAHQ